MTAFGLLVIATALVHFGSFLKVNALYLPGNNTEESSTSGEKLLTTDLPQQQHINNSTVAETGSSEVPLKSCIRSLVDLRQAYLDLKTAPGSRPEHSTIFSFSPTDAVKYTSLAIYYDLSTGEGEDPLSSRQCCNPEDTDTCTVFLRHHSYLYKATYAPLIFLYAFPEAPNHVGKENDFVEKMGRKFGVEELCWKVPPMCTPKEIVGKRRKWALLQAFTAEFPHLVLSANDGPIQVGPVDRYKPGDWEKNKYAKVYKDDKKLAIYSVTLCVFITTTPLFLLAIDTYSTTVSTMLIKSKFAVNCSYMVMFQSWFWALYLIFNTIQILRAMVHTAQNSKKYLYELLMPDVVLCFIVFGVQMGVILIELPFICSYFWKSPVVRDVYKRKSGPPGLLKLRKAAESMGWMGIVVLCQFASVMVSYMVMFLFIDPHYTVTRMGNTALVLLFTAVVSLYAGLSCANCCSCATCTSQKCHKYLLVIMVLLVAGCTNFLAYRVLPKAFTDRTESTATGILSSAVSSAMLAAFGYICKKLVWNRITQEVQEFDRVAQDHSDSNELHNSISNDTPMLSV